MSEVFTWIAETWFDLTGGIQQQLLPLWYDLLSIPVIGDILAFLEETIGRGPSL